MIGENEEGLVCGCDRISLSSEGENCGCSPNVAFTCEEEAILGKMREVKSQVRSVTDRMKELRETFSSSGTTDLAEGESEWAQLSGQLEELRGRWKIWEARLDDAIERKLIVLGHREMPV
jgi:hypothetical protein